MQMYYSFHFNFKRCKKMSIAVSFLTLLLVSATAIPNVYAQEGSPELVSKISDDLVDYARPGWHPRLKLNANVALGQSKNVPGNTDGVSMQLGYLVNGTLDFLSENKSHEWTNALIWELGYSKTPVVDAWIKSMDTIDFRSSYLYHIPKVPWLGPFASFRLSTAMLPSYEVRSEPISTVKLKADESVQYDANGYHTDINGARLPVFAYDAGKKIKLTDGFAPLTLREILGMFAKPIERTEFNLDTRLGFGAWETFVQGGYILQDIDDTAFLELRQLQNIYQMGAELGITIDGMLHKELISYKLSALFMQPLGYKKATEDEWKGPDVEYMNREYEAMVGINLMEFLSINYSFKAYKQPLIIDEWQIQNNLMISIGFDLIGNPPPAPAEPEAEPCVCPGPDELCPENDPAPVIEAATDAPVESAVEENTSLADSTAETEELNPAPNPTGPPEEITSEETSNEQ